MYYPATLSVDFISTFDNMLFILPGRQIARYVARASYWQDRRGACRRNRCSILTIYGLACMAVTCWCNSRLPSLTRRWLTHSLLNV